MGTTHVGTDPIGQFLGAERAGLNGGNTRELYDATQARAELVDEVIVP
jgi:hypothetical protein